MQNTTRAPEEEAEYLKLIKDLKTRKTQPDSIDIEKHKPSQSLDEVIRRMDETNRRLCEMLNTEAKRVSDIVEHYMNKTKMFNDPKYERLFDIWDCKVKEKPANTSKLIDYSFRDKLSGFVCKKDALSWETAKIDEFISSIGKSNMQTSRTKDSNNTPE